MTRFNAKMAATLRDRRAEVALLEEAQAAALTELEQALGAAGLTASDLNPEETTTTGGRTLPLWVCIVATHAAAIRDALEPFDSGVRHAEEKAA